MSTVIDPREFFERLYLAKLSADGSADEPRLTWEPDVSHLIEWVLPAGEMDEKQFEALVERVLKAQHEQEMIRKSLALAVQRHHGSAMIKRFITRLACAGVGSQ